MADVDTLELLVSHGAITRELAQRAAQIPGHIASSPVGRLMAANADGAEVLEALSRITGLPVATALQIERAGAVHLVPSTARQLRDALACPVLRDAQGKLHVLVADPLTVQVLDRLLVGFQAYLAPEPKVRALLLRLYSMGEGDTADAADAVDIDFDASRQNAPAPGPGLVPIDIDFDASQRMSAAPMPPPTPPPPPAPTMVPVDPLAARPSGKHKRPKDEDETQRVQRSPGPAKPRAPTPTPVPAPSPMIAVLDDRTIEEGTAPGALGAAMRAGEERAFLRGALVGASVTAVLAAIVIVALLMR